jgi:hypothetical protein
MPANTVRPLTEHPDITTAVKTSQAVSGEIAQATEESIRHHERELRLAVDTIPGLVVFPVGGLRPSLRCRSAHSPVRAAQRHTGRRAHGHL